MPTYDYECRACGHTFELFQEMSENPKRKCPACGKLKARRLLGTGAGIIFKGSGFYETDYKRKSSGSKPPEKSGSGTKNTDTKKSDSSSEKSSTKSSSDKKD